eukprot:1823778-Prymnesium_polylepis.1
MARETTHESHKKHCWRIVARVCVTDCADEERRKTGKEGGRETGDGSGREGTGEDGRRKTEDGRRDGRKTGETSIVVKHHTAPATL